MVVSNTDVMGAKQTFLARRSASKLKLFQTRSVTNCFTYRELKWVKAIGRNFATACDVLPIYELTGSAVNIFLTSDLRSTVIFLCYWTKTDWLEIYRLTSVETTLLACHICIIYERKLTNKNQRIK